MKRAFTLIEILVSLAITLMMMGAVVALFGIVSDSVSGNRSIIEMSERLRATRNRLQADLTGITVGITAGGLKPPLRPENDEGYLEIIEGPDVDLNYATATTGLGLPKDQNQTSIFGDCDDVLLFTTRSRAEPFVGRINSGFVASGSATIESQVAEVIYFCQQTGQMVNVTIGGVPAQRQLFTLYRRQLLVAPGQLNGALITGGQIPLSPTFYDVNDLSIRFSQIPGTPPTLIGLANTLGDLTKRENRFAHYGIPLPTSFPTVFPFSVSTSTPTWVTATNNSALNALTNARAGDDILMTNVLAFDVQVYDPGAPVLLGGASPNQVALIPSDVAYAAKLTSYTRSPFRAPDTQSADPAGAFVNLGYATGFSTAIAPTLLFNTGMNSASGLVSPPLVFDTWSTHYENDGLPEPSTNTTFDLGTNGLDDNGNGIVDDLAEYDTLPPYAGPLRGIRVIIRAYEPGSQQVREVTVEQDFLPD